MTVVSVFAHAHVRNDDQLRQRRLDGPDRLLHDTLIGKVLTAGGVLHCRDPKEDNGRDIQLDDLLCLANGLVDGELENARHRGDLAPYILAVDDKQWVDKIVGRECCLTHHRTQGLRVPHAPGPRCWKAHRFLSFRCFG